MIIIPYCKLDGVPTLRNTQIAELYNLMVRDNTLDTVFYDGLVQSSDQFVALMTSLDRYLFVAMQDKTVLGFGWAENLDGRAAHAHFCAFAELWGNTTDVGRLLAQTMLKTLDLDILIGYIGEHNERAVKAVLRSGFKILGRLPFGKTFQDGRSEGMTVVYYTEK